ncbi:MAG TPA: alkaline phosphatase D family protein [Blastocatellia bacterium]
MTTTRRKFLKTAAAGAAGAAAGSTIPLRQAAAASSFASAFPTDTERVFIGPEYWANRLQDWRLNAGRVECVESRPGSPMRTLHLLTRRLSSDSAGFTISVRTEALAADATSADAASGFLIGAGGATMDYRAAALIHHQPGPGGGLFAGCDARGQVFFRDFEKPQPKIASGPPIKAVRDGQSEIALELTASPRGAVSELTLIARDNNGGELSRWSQEFPNTKLAGNVALVSHPGSGDYAARFRFRDWRLSGERVEANPSGVCGPILGALYTVHNGTLKLTAQLAPVGLRESRVAELQIRRGRVWKTISAATINSSGWVAQFRVEKWDDRRDAPYRVRYLLKGANGRAQAHVWQGAIKANPVKKDEIVVASLSCVQQINGAIGANPTYRWNYNVNFPHADLTPNLKKHDADLFFFAGDQIYEGNPTRIVREPQDEAELDYLYKWYLWLWAFGDVVRHAPCICIPDDHDVYHGNIWGDGGRAAAPGDPAGLLGGYGMPAGWLNMMQRTQTSHLPDPYDPTPVTQGLGVYYTQLIWGGVGFAILEDRKFKSAPSIVQVEMTRDSHITQKDYDTRKADLPGAQLLGERQLKFLREFSKDWRGQQMKACLSQTIFCNLQISSRPPTTGELDKDLDSNGWPQSGRNAALREFRRGFMIHLAGDQHLASAMQHGIDEFGDACWSQCSPAISNLYTRFWNPDYPAVNPHPELKPFMGDYEDGFHNKITVRAVANPAPEPKPGQFPEPMELHRKATGYNIVRFNKINRTITLETWPRYVDPKTGRQYEGWPITIKQTENYGRKAAAYLPLLKIIGLNDPVVQVVEEASGEVVYTLRIKGDQFRPKVFARGKYSVNIGEPGAPEFKAIAGVDAIEESDSATLEVVFDGK